MSKRTKFKGLPSAPLISPGCRSEPTLAAKLKALENALKQAQQP